MMRLSSPLGLTALFGLGAVLLTTLPARDAHACGCLAPPDPSVPIVQAGERLVFSHKDGKVTAHIQIQYQGTAEDFGWLLPLPSVPEMRLGVEELFAQLVATTQPKYRLTRVTGDQCNFGGGRGAGVPTAANDSGGAESDKDGPVVLQASIGPYRYAVLKADDRKEMFDWLTENHYFVPTGTEDVVGPYIHPGAYFLALKLKNGASVGDLQPVIVEYASDLPMIPIILTSVAANEDMGIQVWVLGEGRGIPRNYRHTILNDEHIDWLNAGANYNDVIIKAVDEADGHHSFVTEYAGSTDPMKNLLDYPGRFGDRATFESTTDPAAYVSMLRTTGFPWTTTMITALTAAFPMPDGVRAAGVSESDFYTQLDWYLGGYRQSHPEQFANAAFTFDPVELTALLFDRIVAPTLEAAKLFRDNPKMTRLYTTLSPEEMTDDPVFSFNPELPDVSNVHEATLTYVCSFFQDGPQNTPAILKLPDGREFYLKNASDWASRDRTGIPYSKQIQLLREEGGPMVEVDNTSRLSAGDSSSGCACAATNEGRSSGTPLAGLALAGLLGLVLRSRRRAR